MLKVSSSLVKKHGMARSVMAALCVAIAAFCVKWLPEVCASKESLVMLSRVNPSEYAAQVFPVNQTRPVETDSRWKQSSFPLLCVRLSNSLNRMKESPTGPDVEDDGCQ